MSMNRQKAVSMKMPECPIVFYIPQPSLPLSAYAELTRQSKRAVQQQANAGSLVLTKEQPGKERRVNMVYEYLVAYQEAQEALQHRV